MPTKAVTAFTVRVDKNLARRLRALAEMADRSVSWMIVRILEEQIDIKESHIKAIRQGMDEASKGLGMDADVFFDQLFAEMGESREGHRRSKRSA